jgi:hypothetical protein
VLLDYGRCLDQATKKALADHRCVTATKDNQRLATEGNQRLATEGNQRLSTEDNQGLSTEDNQGLSTEDNQGLSTEDNQGLSTEAVRPDDSMMKLEPHSLARVLTLLGWHGWTTHGFAHDKYLTQAVLQRRVDALASTDERPVATPAISATTPRTTGGCSQRTTSSCSPTDDQGPRRGQPEVVHRDGGGLSSAGARAADVDDVPPDPDPLAQSAHRGQPLVVHRTTPPPPDRHHEGRIPPPFECSGRPLAVVDNELRSLTTADDGNNNDNDNNQTSPAASEDAQRLSSDTIVHRSKRSQGGVGKRLGMH